MKHISFRFSLTLLTFILGVSSAWTHARISWAQMTGLGSASTSETGSTPASPSSPASAESVKITLARSYKDEYGMVRAEFDVFNGGGEPLYYQGYGDGLNVSWSVRRGSRSHRFSPFCVSGMGVAERELSPGGSVRFEAVIGREAGVVQVGYDFDAGEQRLRQTIWSQDIYIPAP